MAQSTTIKCTLIVTIKEPDGHALRRYVVRAKVPHFPVNRTQKSCLGYALASILGEKLNFEDSGVTLEELQVVSGDKKTVDESLSDDSYETLCRDHSTLLSHKRLISPLS